MKRFLVAASLLMVAGCGNVDWFPSTPANTGASTSNSAPTAFQFTARSIGVANALSGVSDSEATVISGSNASGWTLTLSDTPQSTASTVSVVRATGSTHPFDDGTYSHIYIRGGSNLVLEGPITIYPGDSITISQVIPSDGKTTGTFSTLVTVGTYSTDFKTTIN
jgi:hypothetical protein